MPRFNVVAGAVTTVFSTIDTYKNTSKAINVVKSSVSGAEKTAAISDATESRSSLAMSTGTTLSAIPGLQAVGSWFKSTSAFLKEVGRECLIPLPTSI